MNRRTLFAGVLCLAAPALWVSAADNPSADKQPAGANAAKGSAARKSAATKPGKDDKPAVDDWLAPMDYGPALMTSVARDGKPYKTVQFEAPGVPKFQVDVVPDMVAAKGIVIPVGPKGPDGKPAATVCFDADRLALSAGWTGGWLDLSGSMFTNRKGVNNVTLAGREQFRVDGLGAAALDGNSFVDARSGKPGSTPEARGRFVGHHLHGDRVVLSYRVGDADVLEVPGFEAGGKGGGAFTRAISVGPSAHPVTIAVCDVLGVTSPSADTTGTGVLLPAGDQATAVTLHRDPLAGWGLKVAGGRVWLAVPASKEARVGWVHLRHGPRSELGTLEQAPALADSQRLDPKSLTTAGPERWKPIETVGQLGDAGDKPGARKAADPSFVVDTLTLPDKNPYNSWFRLGGVDFFPDGRAAVCTINGDVWAVSGVDAALKKLTWTRFATGLYQPLGLKVIDGKVCVRGRDQITRLHDLNADGEADFYENLSSEGVTHPSYHGLVFDLQTDADGNLYYARGGLAMDPTLGGHGRIIKLSPDGKSATPIATGLRAPNGLGVVGRGWVTVSDNQGNWIPSSKIHLVDPRKPAEFLGFLPHHHQTEQPTEPVPPLVWLPHKLDNSSGGQCEVPAGGPWAAYAGQWVHSSFGAACVMLLLPDATAPAGEPPKQAAVARLPLDFPTGVMRPRFNPRDGQLYVAGVGGGWQTKGTADGGLYRIRHTGKPGFAPTSFAVVPGGVRLSFAQPLDKTEAADPQNYAVEQWNYKWTEKYGSPDFSAKTPTKPGHDEVEVKAAAVSEDGKTVTLTLAELMPVNQLFVQMNLKTAAGAEFEQEVYATVNAVPGGTAK